MAIVRIQVDVGTVMYTKRETYKKGQVMRLMIEEISRIVNRAGRRIPSDVRSRNGTEGDGGEVTLTSWPLQHGARD